MLNIFTFFEEIYLFFIAIILFGINSCQQDDIIKETPEEEELETTQKFPAFAEYEAMKREASKSSRGNIEMNEQLQKAFVIEIIDYFSNHQEDLDFYLNNIGDINFEIHTPAFSNKEVDYIFFPIIKEEKVSSIFGVEINKEHTIIKYATLTGGGSYDIMHKYFSQELHSSFSRTKPKPIRLKDIIVMGTKRDSGHNYYFEGSRGGGSGFPVTNYNTPAGSESRKSYKSTPRKRGNTNSKTLSELKKLKDQLKDDLREEKLDSIITKDIQDNPCLMKIYENLGKSKRLQEMLNAFKNKIGDKSFNPKISDLTFKYNNTFSDLKNKKLKKAMAITSPSSINNQYINIDITFNTDRNSSSNIYRYPTIISTTSFIHEIIHAQMFKYLWDHKNSNNLYSQSELYNMLKDENHSTLFNEFTSSFQNVQHNVMAENYIEVISQILYEIYPNLTQQEVTALAWIGLENTNAFEQKTKSNPNFSQEKINEIILKIYSKFNEYCY